MPAPNVQHEDQDEGLRYAAPKPLPPDPEPVSREEAPKHQPRRRPGITNVDEFMKIQEAWSNKLPLDDDPTVPDWVVTRPTRSHTDAMTRKMFSNKAMIRLQRSYDTSTAGIRRWWQRLQKENVVKRQKFIPLRHGILGPDLAAGHFVTHRGGRVKFVGHAEWFTDDEVLPKRFDENYLIERMDCTSEYSYL